MWRDRKIYHPSMNVTEWGWLVILYCRCNVHCVITCKQLLISPLICYNFDIHGKHYNETLCLLVKQARSWKKRSTGMEGNWRVFCFMLYSHWDLGTLTIMTVESTIGLIVGAHYNLLLLLLLLLCYYFLPFSFLFPLPLLPLPLHVPSSSFPFRPSPPHFPKQLGDLGEHYKLPGVVRGGANACVYRKTRSVATKLFICVCMCSSCQKEVAYMYARPTSSTSTVNLLQSPKLIPRPSNYRHGNTASSIQPTFLNNRRVTLSLSLTYSEFAGSFAVVCVFDITEVRTPLLPGYCQLRDAECR